MTKKLLSIAALTALLSTGASAFNTNHKGEIIVSKNLKKGHYSFVDDNNTAGQDIAKLLVTDTVSHGDALIYPYFTQKNDWSSEVYVRNDSDKSMVAKVALYSLESSEEVKDFNIYLSPHDVYRFKIQNGKINLDEDSVVTYAPDIDARNYSGEKTKLNASSVKAGKNGVAFGDVNPVDIPLKTECGYIVIYGMAQVSNADNVHHNHIQLFSQYRKLLDGVRNGWRDGFGTGTRNFESGTYKNGIAAPAIKVTDELNALTSYNWESPDASLTGTIRVLADANESGNDARDMLLPAFAMQNYTDNDAKQIMLWTEGETASLADRRFAKNPDTGRADYAKDNLVADGPIATDAKSFSGDGFYFRFDNAEGGAIANNLIFNQPLKRVLTQLGNHDGFWEIAGTNPSGFVTGEKYYFTLRCHYWDEKENKNTVATGSGLITSPYNPTPKKIEPFKKEIVILTDDLLENDEEAFGTKYNKINGYADCYMNSDAQPPAIVSQMVGSDINGHALTNWTYSVKKNR